MKQRVIWTAAESLPERAAVLRLQGLPRNAAPSPRIAALLEAALATYAEMAEPRALVGEILREAFGELYRGEGRNAPETPLETIFPQADRLRLFTATVGGKVTSRIRELFGGNQPAAAAMLDSTASAAADRLADLLGERFLAEVLGDADAASARHVLAYSPGYCGWHVSGQRALFAYLGPEDIGVTLNDSFLMDPLKSISGVLVAGAPEIHRFTPAYPFCAECRDKPCRGRLAALPRS